MFFVTGMPMRLDLPLTYVSVQLQMEAQAAAAPHYLTRHRKVLNLLRCDRRSPYILPAFEGCSVIELLT